MDLIKQYMLISPLQSFKVGILLFKIRKLKHPTISSRLMTNHLNSSKNGKPHSPRKIKTWCSRASFQWKCGFCNSILTNENQYLFKSYPTNGMKKVKKHFPDTQIIQVHDFRKTNTSLLFESSATINGASQRLGHKSTKFTTDSYIKVT